jgi:GAF domain-containing protein
LNETRTGAEQDAQAEILSLARSLLSDLDLQTVLERVAAAARELTGARYAALGVLDSAGARLERFITIGIDDETRTRLGPPPVGLGVLGELIRDPRPLRLSSVKDHPRSYGFPIGHPPMHRFLGVPIMLDGQPYGNLYLTDKEDGDFTDADEDAIVALAEFAAIAIDHAQRMTRSSRRMDELERTVAALDATVQIAQALAGETDTQSVLELVVKRGRALASASAAAIERVVADGGRVVAAVAGDLPRTLRGQPLGADREVAHEVDLVFRGERLAVLVLLGPIDGDAPIDEDQRRLLAAFASSAATALGTALTVQQSHDGAHGVAAELEHIRRRLDAARDETSMEALRATVADCADELSRVCGEIRGFPAVDA